MFLSVGMCRSSNARGRKVKSRNREHREGINKPGEGGSFSFNGTQKAQRKSNAKVIQK